MNVQKNPFDFIHELENLSDCTATPTFFNR